MLFSYAMKDNKQFNRCFRNGRYCSCPMVTAYYLQNEMPCNRIGISVSKKIGSAVERNRAKRIIRAAYRLHENEFPVGLDIVFAVRPGIKDKTSNDIEDFISHRLLKDMSKAFNENGELVKRPSGKKR